MSPILSVENLSIHFGGLVAVDNLSFQVDPQTIHGLIGPNGAGKTTTFNLISGYYKPSSGRVRLDNADITGMPMYDIARAGLVRTFQHATLFKELTVRENMLIGTHNAYRPSIWRAITGADAKVQEEANLVVNEVMDFFQISHFANLRASDLSYGHQKVLGLGIALCVRPKMLILDEPFTGMNPEETRVMMEHMERLRDSGMTILLVEHDMKAIMGLCSKITCMSFGKLLAEGNPKEIRSNPAVIEAYLGGGNHA